MTIRLLEGCSLSSFVRAAEFFTVAVNPESMRNTSCTSTVSGDSTKTRYEERTTHHFGECLSFNSIGLNVRARLFPLDELMVRYPSFP